MSARIPRRAGRYAVVIVALILVAVASLALSIASARTPSAAARSALIPIIAAFQQAQQQEAADRPPGEEPSPADAAAIERAVLGYLRAIDSGEWEVAWGFTHPDSRGGIEISDWSLPQIARMGGGIEDQWRYRWDYALPTLMMGADVSLGTIVTEEMSGWAELTVTTEVPGTLVLRRLGDDWAVDLTETRQREVRDAVSRQLEAFAGGEDDPFDFFRAMMMADEGTVAAVSITDLALSPQMSAEFRVAEARLADGTAEARVVGTSRFRVAMPLANGDRGWSIAWCREPVLLGPEDSFDDIVAGRLKGAGATQACQSNLKQLALAMLMYAQDYDEQLPIADRWCAATWPYIRNREIHHCPADDAAFSYAYNYKLSRQALDGAEEPARTIALYESEIGRGDAFDWPDYPGTSLPVPGRHEEGNNYAWADGHVSWAEPWGCGVQEDAYRLERAPVPPDMPPGMMPGMMPPEGIEMMPPPEPPREE